VNKDLYGQNITLPEKIINHLDNSFSNAKGASDSTEGYRRNKELRDKGAITYQGLKRIKNWFDKFNGQPNDLSYTLNGGDYMKNWVNQQLQSMRGNVYNTKKNKSEAGMENQFISTHTKDNLNNLNRPSKSHSKNDMIDYDVAVTESLRRINDLIKKII
jgi:hypothetical protein